MGFPYLAPLAPWVVDIMKQREEFPIMGTFKSPWVILTSGALVSKVSAETDVEKRREQIEGLIRGDIKAQDIYRGCIISNNINNTELSYSTQQTAIGKDFTGKVIVVEGEVGRKVSTPIVESIELDTDGANNTLKTAKVSVRCFTLKQLEMFELFFLKPGMNVLVEFGDSTLLKSSLFPLKKSEANQQTQNKKKFARFKDGSIDDFQPFTKIEEALVPKNAYDEFCKNFSEYYRSDTNAIAAYLQKVEQSLGSYDLVAGKVLDYSFSIANDGTYDVTFEVSQGNQISLAIPHNPKKSVNSSIQAAGDKTTLPPYDQIVELIVSDLNLGDVLTFKNKVLAKPHPEKDDGKTWQDEWFNFLKINEQQKDTVASDEAYVSLRFILDILMNFAVPDTNGNIDVDFFKLNLPKCLEGKKERYILPVTSNKYIISSDSDIIFPTNELPRFIATSDAENKIGIADKPISGLINGYNFHVTSPEKYEIPNSPKKETLKPNGNNERVGNALNIFIRYAAVVKAWRSATTRVDFLENILTMCNQNSYGLFMLSFAVPEQNAPPTIVDMKGAPTNGKIDDNSTIYRFKPNTINSNVLEFSFNFEMSNLVAGRQIFNSGKFLAEAKDAKTVVDPNTGKLPLPAKAYKMIDNATMGNADGWYSINNVELLAIQKKYETVQSLKGTEIPSEEKKSETATTEADITSVISQKSINFILKKSAKDLTTLIFKDGDIVTKYIYNKQQADKEKKPTLSPIDVTLTVNGFSGFTPGQYFRIDGIPEIYNQIGVFQITNTKHSISPDGWKTTIEASHRITPKK